jgi:Protein of unknown function (DUF3892)
VSIRITCINKDGGFHENPYVAISNLGWQDRETGATGRSSRDEMYKWVKAGGEAYVEVGLARARLIAEISPRGTRFVKTMADNTVRDNLLKLVECA